MARPIGTGIRAMSWGYQRCMYCMIVRAITDILCALSRPSPPRGSMAVANLHFDVLYCIISDIHRGGDLATLVTCVQVCRLWHIVGRRLIFGELRVSTGTRLAQLENLLLVDPDIGPLVRKLRIHPRVPNDVPTASKWIIGIPRILPAKLINLRHIELVGLYESGRYCPDAFFRGFCRFTAVETLTVRDSTIVVNLLYAFIASLPNLKHISVGFMRPLIASVFPYPIQLLDPKFTSLDLNIGRAYLFGLKSLLDWITQTSAGITLRSLYLDVYEEQVADAGKFLSEGGQFLEHLSLDIRPLGTVTTIISKEREHISAN